MEEMVNHQRRVVRQIAGAPYAAVKAAGLSMGEANKMGLLEPSSPSTNTYDQAKGPAGASLKGISKWLNAGRQAVSTFQRELLLDRSEKKIRGFHQELMNQANQVMVSSEEDLEFLSSVDRRLIQEMVSRGFMRRLPEIKTLESSATEQGPHAVTGYSLEGQVNIVGDRLGNVLHMLPDDAVDKANVANSARSTFSSMDHGKCTLERWFALLHEASHCEYAVTAQRFCPSGNKMDPQAIQDMNDWVFGVLSPSSNAAKSLLSEAQADALGAIMLLEATNHAPESKEVLEAWHRRRSLARQESDALAARSWAENPGESPGKVHIYGGNEWVLRKVLDSSEEWRGLPPEDLKRKALEIASDGVLEYLDVNRKSPDGQPVGLASSMSLVNEAGISPGYIKAVAVNLSFVKAGYTPGTGEWLSESGKPLPYVSAATSFNDALGSRIDEVLDSPVPEQYRRENIHTFRDAAALPIEQRPKRELWEKLAGVADSHVVEPGAIEDRAFDEAAAEADRVSENIQHALGLSSPQNLAYFKPEEPVSAPEPERAATNEASSLLSRFSLPSLGSWRARRDPTQDSSRPSQAPSPMA